MDTKRIQDIEDEINEDDAEEDDEVTNDDYDDEDDDDDEYDDEIDEPEKKGKGILKGNDKDYFEDEE